MSGNAFLFRYEGREKRLYWRKQERKWRHMVQGVSRQVIVVRSPDPRLFEQAIFILTKQYISKKVHKKIFFRFRPFLSIPTITIRISFSKKHWNFK